MSMRSGIRGSRIGLAVERMKRLTRRSFLRGTSALCLRLTGAAALTGCAGRVVQVERVIEKEVTKIVTEVVRQTVVVERAPHVIEKTVEKVITIAPAPKPGVTLVADVTNYGWTQFAMLVSPTFGEMFPNLTMKWRSPSDWREYPRRIAALHASGQLGDLVETPPGVLPVRWAQQGVIRPLDDIIADDGFDTSGILKGPLRAYLYQGKQMGLPFIGNAGENLLLYGKGLFDEAGVSHPTPDWTLDDLHGAAEALTRCNPQDGRVAQFGYAIRYRLPGAYPMLHLFGANLFSRGGLRSTLSSPNAIHCLTWAHDLVHVAGLAPSPPQVESGPLGMFRAGRLAMLRYDLRALVNLGRTMQDGEEIGSVVFPRQAVTGKAGTSASGMAYCISQKTAFPHEAFQWVKFMSSREMGVQLFLGDYADPGCRMASWKDPRVVELYPVCAQIADAANAAESARLPWNLRVRECLDAWNRGIGPLWFDEITPEVCASTIAREIDRVLAYPMEESSSEALWLRGASQ